MGRIVLLIEPYVTFKIDPVANILFVDWWGNINMQNVMDGSALMIRILEREKCTKVLNNNSNVTGFWKGTNKWASAVGLPRIEETTCEYFAWVKPPSSDLNYEYVERLNLKRLEVCIFSSLLAGERWILNQQQQPVVKRNTYVEMEYH